jgi:hypothetical protein
VAEVWILPLALNLLSVSLSVKWVLLVFWTVISWGLFTFKNEFLVVDLRLEPLFELKLCRFTETEPLLGILVFMPDELTLPILEVS